MSVAGGNNTEQSGEHFCWLFFFLPAIANSCDIAEPSLYIRVVEENPEPWEVRESKKTAIIQCMGEV